jgi:hypothetical protein
MCHPQYSAFASTSSLQAGPIWSMTASASAVSSSRTTLDQLLECPVDQRIAVEGGLQRVASVIVMQELFSMR